MIRFKSWFQQDCLIGYANRVNTLLKSFVLVKFNSIAHAARGASDHHLQGSFIFANNAHYRLAVALSAIH